MEENLPAVKDDLDRLEERKYPIDSIENGKTTLYDLKKEAGYETEESIKVQNEKKEKSVIISRKRQGLFLLINEKELAV